MNEDGALSSSPSSPVLLRSRREPFEHGLLPLPKLIFTDGTQSLSSIKQKLLSASSPSQRVSADALADALQIPLDLSSLVLHTLHSVLPVEVEEQEVGGTVDLHDLLLFLYIQTYKRLLPRTHKDSVAVADVWPSTSAFDGYLSALSPLQLVRSNSRKFMPSQADEEAHQLSYLQKHMANLLTLLAESVGEEEDGSLLLTQERFERLGLLLQLGDKGCEGNQLSQAAPFFANADPDMPAAPVPASQVHDWIAQNIGASLEHIAEKASSKENGPQDADVTMADVCTSQNQTSFQSSLNSRGPSFVEGISKTSVVKQASDIRGSTMKVLNCHDSVIYILAPLRYATIYGCSDATVVLGAVGKSVRVEHCERVQIIAAAKRVCIANCRECVFYLGVNQHPLILGDNHKLQVAPYNTFYPQLRDHMNEVHIDASVNKWNEPLVLGMVDPHDSLSHPAGVSDAQAESPACLDPDLFTNFLIPNWFVGESSEPTKDNPFQLPENYIASLKKHHLTMNDVQQAIRDLQVEDNKKRELASALHLHFKEWLYASGHIRQLYCLQND